MMSSLEDTNFLYHYQSTKFQDSDVDPFIACNVTRKCLAQSHQGSIALCGNDTTCLLLQKNLQTYANIVDNKENGKVNNYAQSILEMVSLIGTKNANSSQWKSGLKSIDPKTFIQFIEPPKCDISDDNGFCQSAKVTEEDICVLLANRNHKLSDNNECLEKPSAGSNKTASFTPQSPNVGNVKDTGQLSHSNWQNSGNFFNRQAPMHQRQSTDICQPMTFSKRTGQSPMDIDQGILDTRPRPPDPGIHSSRFRSSAQPTNQSSFKNITSTYQAASNDLPSTMFTTARDELAIQNAKKWGSRRGAQRNVTHYGNQGNRYPMETPGSHNQGYGASLNYGGAGEEPLYNNQGYRGTTKKTLGCRRGVMNKFIPPVRRGNEEEQTGGKVTWGEEQQNEDVDERLKNIDPKMVELIRSEIMDNGSPVQWDDIAGLEFAKATIQEIVVWPLLRPDIFTGLRRPPKGILLFGPPGTGKTLIGKCIASQSCSTFFSISASSLTSKWIGDGEKMVRALFAVASCHQPAVVFIDEIDSLLTQRSDSEHESSRRIKTEFLVQLDGATTGEDDRTLVIGATNRPQELDEAARRRLVKRLYIPLPEFAARRQLVERLMSSERHCLTDVNIEEISRLTEGYSGADMKNLCQEACLGPIRSLGMMQIKHIQPNQVRAVDLSDFKAALTRVRASVSPDDLDNYIKWDKTFGSGGAGIS